LLSPHPPQDLKNLLRPCLGHVDVILDPYVTGGQWYPYWEGARRMAPQFRSKGIGYDTTITINTNTAAFSAVPAFLFFLLLWCSVVYIVTCVEVFHSFIFNVVLFHPFIPVLRHPPM
jgi:hypothetical protein